MKPFWLLFFAFFFLQIGRAQIPVHHHQVDQPNSSDQQTPTLSEGQSEQAVLSWAHQFGNSEGTEIRDIAVDPVGNVYTIGIFKGTIDLDPGPGVASFTTFGHEDVFISKLSPSGDFRWAKQIGGEEEEFGNAITLDQYGNLYIVGSFNGLADFNPSGGTVNLLPIGGEDAFVCKLDTFGFLIWASKVGGIDDDEANAVAVNTNGDVVFAGFFNGTGDFDPGIGVATLTSAGGQDGFITTLDAGGIFVWAKQVGGTLDDVINDLTLNVNDQVVSTGRFRGTVDFDPGAGTNNMVSAGKNDVFVLNLDVLGNFTWAARMGSGEDDEGLAIDIDNFGNICTSGYFSGTVDFDPGSNTDNLISEGGKDVFISKWSPNLDFVWAKRFGSTSDDVSSDLTTDYNRTVYATGFFTGAVDFDPNAGSFVLTSTGMNNAFISKLSEEGEFVSASQLSTDQEIEPQTIDVDYGLHVYCAGNFDGSGDFDPGPGQFILTATGAENDAFLVKINPCFTTADTIDVAACESYISPSGTYIWSTPGTYLDTIVNVHGCDSVITINLSIHESSEAEIFVSSCEGYLTPGGDILTESGIYTEVIPNTKGCDSTIIINLTILQNTAASIEVTSCNSYTSPGGTAVWTQSGTYHDTISNNIGCDSLITVFLTIDTLNTNVIHEPDDPILTAEATGVAYQWVDCMLGYEAIPGATAQSYAATVNGFYAVIVSLNDCADTSACYQIGILATHELSGADRLKIYPNPANDFVIIEMTDVLSFSEITIYDVQGIIVMHQELDAEKKVSVNLHQSPGVYVVALKGKSGLINKRLIVR